MDWKKKKKIAEEVGQGRKIRMFSQDTSERLHKTESVVFKPPEALTKEVVSPGSTSKGSRVIARLFCAVTPLVSEQWKVTLKKRKNDRLSL